MRAGRRRRTSPSRVFRESCEGRGGRGEGRSSRAQIWQHPRRQRNPKQAGHSRRQRNPKQAGHSRRQRNPKKAGHSRRPRNPKQAGHSRRPRNPKKAGHSRRPKIPKKSQKRRRSGVRWKARRKARDQSLKHHRHRRLHHQPRKLEPSKPRRKAAPFSIDLSPQCQAALTL